MHLEYPSCLTRNTKKGEHVALNMMSYGYTTTLLHTNSTVSAIQFLVLKHFHMCFWLKYSPLDLYFDWHVSEVDLFLLGVRWLLIPRRRGPGGGGKLL